MSRNSSGIYSLPSGNPVITGTTITSTWANTTMPDIGNEITNSLDRAGRGSMTGQLKVIDGAQAAPGMSWGSEPSSGFFRGSAGSIGLSVLNTLIGTMTATGVVWTLALGSAALPSLAFSSDPNTGIYSPGADQLGFATAGVSRGTVNATGNWSIAAPSSGDTLVINSLTGQVSVRGGVVSSTNNPRFEFWHTESSGLTVLDFTGSVGPSARIAIGGAPCIDITPYRNISIAAPSSGTTLTVTAAAGSARVADFSAGTNATHSIKLPGQVIVGQANGAYGAVGYNWDCVASSATMNYGLTDFASRIMFQAGGFYFQTAPSGTAGNPITFTTAVAIAQSGNVNIATPSSSVEALTVGGVGVAGAYDGKFTHSSADTSPASLNIPNLSLDNTNTTNGNYSALMFRSVTSGGSLSYGATIAGVASGKTVGGYDMALHFYTRNAAGTVATPLVLTEDGRLYGTALHNNAGSVTGTTTQYIASGTYTPTTSNGVNITSATGRKCNWTRVGNVVSITGAITIDPATGGSTSTSIQFSLPIASNFTTDYELSGTISHGGWAAYTNFTIHADSASNLAWISFTSVTDVGAIDVYFTASYEVL